MKTGEYDNPDEGLEECELPRLTPADRIREWWSKATGPVYRAEHASLTQALSECVLLWMPVVLSAAVLASAVGAYFFTGWRARDLAAKAVTSAESGNFRLAAIQVESARQLRPKHPDVVKARALVASIAGDPSSVELWSEFPLDVTSLLPREMASRSESLVKFGDAVQRRQALADLDTAGLVLESDVARARLAFQSGNLQTAALYARRAVARDPAPIQKLFLARVLVARHRPFLRDAQDVQTSETRSAVEEITQLIDSMEDSKEADEARALGLAMLRPDPQSAGRWARKSWQSPIHTDPALLPAATWMIASGEMPREEVIARLRFVFAGAPLPWKAAFAEWLMTTGEARTVLQTLSARDATQHPGAFTAYTRALAREGKWESVLDLASGDANVPEPVRLVAVAYAARELRKSGQAEKAFVDALKAAASMSLLEQTLEALEGLDLEVLADQTLIALCSDAFVVDAAFAAARERFERRGRHEELGRAFENARAIAPAAPTVADYAHYSELLAGRLVDPAATSKAMAENVNRPAFRITHALALLRAGKPAEAFAVFDDFTIFFHALGPSAQAVVTSIWGAKGDAAGARELARTVDLQKISPAEYNLMSSCLHADLRAKD